MKNSIASLFSTFPILLLISFSSPCFCDRSKASAPAPAKASAPAASDSASASGPASASGSAPPELDAFLKCLPSKCQSSPPIADFIYNPSNSSYEAVLKAYCRNLRYFPSSPLLIITATDESHVQATVTCAKLNNLQIRIRSGGHDYDALSYAADVPFILLDMNNLRNIEINAAEQKAWVQAGATLGELYYKISQTSNTLAYPSGVCFTIGIGGHITGGGYSNMIRKFGLSIDNVCDAKIVNANGEILDRKGMGEDLFWAIRGGGAASFCVILAWHIDLVTVPETVTVFKIEKTIEEGATDLVVKWQEVAPKIDPELFIRLMPDLAKSPQNPEKKTVKVTFLGQYIGDPKALLDVMGKKFPELGVTEKDCLPMKWIESVLVWMGVPQGTPTDVVLKREPPMVGYIKRKSDYVREPIPKKGFEEIWDAMIRFDNVGFQFNPYGGKMDEIPETETAFPHRAGVLFLIQYSANWMDGSIAAAEPNMNSTRALYEFLTPYVTKNPREAFLNYRDIDLGTNKDDSCGFGFAYFKNNFQRLVDVKKAVDPDNFFKYDQSIPLEIKGPTPLKRKRI